jgi:hypothetical protein
MLLGNATLACLCCVNVVIVFSKVLQQVSSLSVVLSLHDDDDDDDDDVCFKSTAAVPNPQQIATNE